MFFSIRFLCGDVMSRVSIFRTPSIRKPWYWHCGIENRMTLYVLPGFFSHFGNVLSGVSVVKALTFSKIPV